jgi:predicted metal-dependent peptidase
MHPARRMLSQDIYLPGLRSEELGDIVIAVDESGSMSGVSVSRAFAELGGILSSGYEMRVSVIHHDSEIVAVETWAPGDPAPEFKRRACGGTSHIPVFDWIAENCPDCRLLVCMSDMYSSFPQQPPEFPVVWIVIAGQGHPGSAPYGRAIQMTD